jgi:cytidylate kinase
MRTTNRAYIQEDQRLKPARNIRVAIDGPAGAGKSTVARLVAARLGYVHVDTGAMYRAVAWHMMQVGIPPTDPARIAERLDGLRLELKPAEGGQQVWLCGRDVTGLIRSPDISRTVSLYAQIPEVRRFLTGIQKRLAEEGGIVMDGRDIGTKVLPDAELKIFLTASVEERAARRYRELVEAGERVDLEVLKREIAERDRLDRERKESPLKMAEDAVLIDCTSMTVDQVVGRIAGLAWSVIHGADA